ncbi:hypothetical protein OSCT_1823 [Oscillochloris trichoides DG-6]|uniref:Glycosyltransferase RgtA/B/C/D-like domain-containing protein n=1 Tax=Oscillochloris trichoides DG-6 TaxID=765420 RepID=E1IES2_9CHLR|nr:hypothetical protein OSCT_1823 [Oscillochloris trichoides DG-6]
MPHARLISFGLGAGTLIIVGSTAFYPMTMVTSVPNLWGLLPWAVLGGLPTLYCNYFRIRAYFICHPKVLITTVFAFSRVVTYAIGVRYDGTSLDGFWQYISPSLLKTDFLRSLFYMHSQPPLFNLFLGLVVNLFPGSEVIVFHVVFIAISLVLALALNALMERLGMRRQMSLLLTILFVVSPTAILYENWLMYNYPVTSVLCVAAVFLHRFLSDWNLRDGLVFFGALAIACGTISTFHLLWLVMFVIMLLWTCRHAWKKVLIACSLPLLLVGALYGKNLVLYGSPTSSTWFGMSLWRVVANGLSTDEINAAITAGRLSPTARIMPFQQLSTYRGVVSSAPPTGIPILDAKNSYHHLAYVGISKQYLIDSITILRTNPTLYIPGIKQSWYFFFTPSSDQPWFYANTNRAKLGYLDRAYNLVLLGQMDYPTSPIVFNLPNEAFQGRLLMVWYGIALLYGLGVTAPTILLRFPRSRPFAITVAFLWLNVVYVSLVGTLFEVGENSRFRLMIDPFLLVLVGLAFTEVLRRIRRA